MGHAVLLAAGLWLFAAGSAEAQAPVENSLPEGTFASTQGDCTKLETNSPAELGEELNFEVLTHNGVVGYEQACEFVQVLPRDATSWVATAFCEETGYSFPDLFAIRQKEEGRLNVTRSTDLNQQAAYDPSSEPSADKPRSTGEPEDAGAASADPEPSSTAPDEPAPESYSTFVKCENVKP